MTSSAFEQLKRPLVEACQASKRVALLIRDDEDFTEDVASICGKYPTLEDLVSEPMFRCALVPSLTGDLKESMMKYRVSPILS